MIPKQKSCKRKAKEEFLSAYFIANSLDMKTLRPTYNPFAFKNFTQDKFLMQMMDDVYNGQCGKYL